MPDIATRQPPPQPVTDRWLGISAQDAAISANGGYGADKRKSFHADWDDLVRLARLGEAAQRKGFLA